MIPKEDPAARGRPPDFGTDEFMARFRQETAPQNKKREITPRDVDEWLRCG
jgi:hypothetical protein